MHQAGKIGRNNIFCAGGQGIFYFLIGHANGNGFKFYSKGSAKAATGFHIIHFYQFQSFHIGQQFTGLLFYFAFPQACAGIMISGFAIEYGAYIFYLQNIHHKFGEFKCSFAEILYFIMHGRIIE